MVVYSLSDPQDNVLRYIGITSHTAQQRFSRHLKDAKKKVRYNEYLSRKEKWLLDLESNGMKPIIKTIAEGLSEDGAMQMEQELIAKFKRVCDGGTLYNVQEGGYYDSKKATPWNRGAHGCYSEEFILNNRKNQPNSKKTYVFRLNGEYVGEWDSVRRVCDELNLDRRAVMRCLKGDPFFHSHKGYMFNHVKELPVFENDTSAKRLRNREIVATKDGIETVFRSVTATSQELGIPRSRVCNVLIGRQKTTGGYSFKYKDNGDS